MARVEVGFGVLRLVLGIATFVGYMLAGEARADLILYRFDFGTTASTTGFATSIVGVTDPNFTLSAITGSNNGNYTTIANASSGYIGASGGNSLENRFRDGLPLTSSEYVSLTINNNTGVTQFLTDFDFGVRSTPTGPQNYSLRSSSSNFAAEIVGGAISNNSQWGFKDNAFQNVAIGVGLTELRLFGYNGTGEGNGNGRFDDFAIQFNITAVPEPSSMALVGFMGGVATVWGWRKRRSEGKVTEH